MSGKTVRRMEGKTRTSARQTKQLSATKAIQVAFDKHGEKIYHHKRTAEEVKMVIPWDFVHSKKPKNSKLQYVQPVC